MVRRLDWTDDLDSLDAQLNDRPSPQEISRSPTPDEGDAKTRCRCLEERLRRGQLEGRSEPNALLGEGIRDCRLRAAPLLAREQPKDFRGREGLDIKASATVRPPYDLN